MRLTGFLGLGLAALPASAALGALLFAGAFNSQAVQNATISLDMVPSGNGYDDTIVMVAGQA